MSDDKPKVSAPPGGADLLDLSESTGFFEDVQPPSADEMLAKQREQMRAAEAAAMARKGVTPTIKSYDSEYKPIDNELPAGMGHSYRWEFSKGPVPELVLHNVTAGLADDLSHVFDEHGFLFKRYKATQVWSAE